MLICIYFCFSLRLEHKYCFKFADETTKKSDEICTFPQPLRRNLYVPEPYLEENNYEDIESFRDYDGKLNIHFYR